MGPLMRTHLIEWGVTARMLPGQEVTGDLYVVEASPAGVLVAVIDGLGHGEAAAAAARIAADTLAAHAQEDVISLVRRCHERLYGTRGAVTTLASFSATQQRLTWLAVGNVEGVLLRAASGGAPVKEHVLQRGGVVGYQLPSLHASTLEIAPGDTLILATDGISAGFAGGAFQVDQPQHTADRIVAEFGKETDDALVLVARYTGAVL